MRWRGLASLVLAGLVAACGDGSDGRPDSASGSLSAPAGQTIHSVAHGCFAVASAARDYLVADPGAEQFQWRAGAEDSASRFRLQPADLGVYLLYDEQGRYLTSDGSALLSSAVLAADTYRDEESIVIEDRRQSEGEWALSSDDATGFRLQHLRSGGWLGDRGLASEEAATALILQPAGGCADFPELSLDATGQISRTRFDDGDLFGFVETHSHLLTNYAFGGGGVFHGAPFHRLGVEHALRDCELSHGEEGRRDIMGFGGDGSGSIQELIPALVSGELAEKSHDTDGFPTFSDWPDAPRSATHQVQYYKWLQRAWLGGLRLLVQHATTNEVQCQLVVGIGAQPQRYDCNDMVAVDRIIEETYALERYIDAQSGGPGTGWFRIVSTPEQAREEIGAGNLAVVLGIETTDLFNCFLTPFGDFERCSREDVIASLDAYHKQGVRVLFPVHKFDNGFSAGDGDRGAVLELGNVVHTGHYGHLAPCPEDLLGFDGGYDSGSTDVPDLHQPRLEYLAPPVLDMSGFPEDPVGTLLPLVGLLGGEPEADEYCHSHGLTELGEFLAVEMMKRGMIIEVDHFPRRSYQRIYEILEAYEYPAVGSHGRHNNGRLYQLGGVSKTGIGGCRSASQPGTTDDSLQERIAMIRAAGGYPAEGFGFDLNGFAGAPGPRFGDHSACGKTQTDDGVTYPFDSYAGDVTFSLPRVGERTLDFNTEGMVHVGLIPELIEDVRRDGVSDTELEPLFRSAEGYLRMWEKAVTRGQEISSGVD
jgi:microsomal dipeptidase-like Zn-dependent dipeptidase